MDFTREPIIETVITPREGFKLVVRSSKGIGQEEYFVDAVEVVSFGQSCFFRSLEKPKAFIVPANDYEVLEVREARIVLKNVGLERSIKIGGGREPTQKAPAKEPAEPIVEEAALSPEDLDETAAPKGEAQSAVKGESKADRKRDRRRHYRRRRGREEGATGSEDVEILEKAQLGEGDEKISLSPPNRTAEQPSQELQESINVAANLLSSLLTPPPLLISETLSKYKENVLFQGAFYERTKEQAEMVEEKEPEEAAQVSEEAIAPFPETPLEEKLHNPEPQND